MAAEMKQSKKVWSKQKLLTGDALDKAIDTLGDQELKLRERVHLVAISILKEWEATYKKGASQFEAAQVAAGRINRLNGMIPYYAKRLNNWVLEYTPLIFNEEKEHRGWYAKKSESEFKGKAFMDARDNPFWTIKAGKPEDDAPFNIFKEIAVFRKKLERAHEKASDKDVVDPEFLNMLRNYAAKHEKDIEKATAK